MSPEDPILKQAGLNIARKLAEKYRSIDALSRVPMGDCQQGLGLLTELFEHIDTQAAQIEALKEEADCSDIVLALEDAGIMGDGEQDIITAIEILGSRIDAMKEKLVEERARRICHNPREDMVGHWPRYEDIVVKEARQQLKADPNLQMAGVEWG